MTANAFGQACPPVAPPTTSHPLGELADWKTVDPASGTSVQAGRVLTYTLHFANTGAAAVDINRDDVLFGVLDDTPLTSPATASESALAASAVSNGSFSVTGSLAPGQEVTVVYTVTVNADGAPRGDSLGNFLLDPGTETRPDVRPPTGSTRTAPATPSPP
jgi:hypothetical protein